jgi:hypothetical protein
MRFLIKSTLDFLSATKSVYGKRGFQKNSLFQQTGSQPKPFFNQLINSLRILQKTGTKNKRPENQIFPKNGRMYPSIRRETSFHQIAPRLPCHLLPRAI